MNKLTITRRDDTMVITISCPVWASRVAQAIAVSNSKPTVTVTPPSQGLQSDVS